MTVTNSLIGSPQDSAYAFFSKMAYKLLEDARPAVAGLAGGSLATLTLHPLDLLKTRQSVHGNGGDAKAREAYQSLTRAVRLIVEKEGGVKGLYAGVGANVLVSGSSWGIYFMSYVFL